MRHHALLPGLAFMAVAALPACGDDSGGPLPPPPVALDVELVGSLDVPVQLTAPAGDARLFVATKGGTVRVFQDGTLLPTPFLDISDIVHQNSEQGLLGLAFDPGYATNGRFFVSYTSSASENVVASYTVSTGDPNVANPVAEDIRLRVAQPRSNHNGGHITFGPDGFLYVGRGDGGGGGDPDHNGQSTATLLGKILRLDVSGAAGYTIPATNPFAGSTASRPEIWSWGLRNPWQFTFDRANGDLYIADVGQDDWEEVNVATAGSGAGRALNFGWNIMEGLHCYEPSSGCDMSGLTLPVLEYSHDDGCSIAGGYVYRGSAIPALQGTYFYGDLCGTWIRTFRHAGGEATEQADSGLDVGGIIAFGEDAAGELYILTAEGAIYRIVAG